MLIINQQTVNGRATYDLGTLLLPDGRLAHQLSREDLFKTLSALKVPNIDNKMGAQDLLIKFAEHKATEAKP